MSEEDSIDGNEKDGGDDDNELGEACEADDKGKDLPEVPLHVFLPVVPAARVIGKGGASIKAIRKKSGAFVRILQKELPDDMQRREDRVAILEGSPDSLQNAIFGVLERVFDRSGLPDNTTASRSQDRAHIVDLIVPEKSGSHLIGQRGDRIKALMEETGCDLSISKEPMTGMADFRRVRVTGNSCEEVSSAVWKVHEVLMELVSGGALQREQFTLRSSSYSNRNGGGLVNSFSVSRPSVGKDIPMVLLIAQEDAAWIVGKRGNKITKLREFAKVQMNDADAPPFEEAQRFLEISQATLDQKMRVLQMVVEDLASRKSTPTELRLLVPTDHFGSVMGHRGETIRGIMASTGAKLQQHKAEKLDDGSDYRLRLVIVRGTDRQRLDAVAQVHSAIENRSGARQSSEPVVGASAPGLGAADFGFDSDVAAASGFGGGIGGFAGSASIGGGSSTGSFVKLGVAQSQPVLGGLGPGAGSNANPGLGVATGQLAGGFGGCNAGALSGLLAGVARASKEGTTSAKTHTNGGDSGLLTLQLAMPSEEVTQILVDDSSGIAWRAGVQLSVARGAGNLPILQVVGTAVGNAVACYLIQDRLFMLH